MSQPGSPQFVPPPDVPPTAEVEIPAPPKGRIARTWSRIRTYREEHATAELALCFAAGFLFDVLTLTRIDDTVTLVQQGAYLGILALALGLETRQSLQRDLPRALAKGLELAEDVIHFFFGSLLSSFALFYFKSASGLTALAFVAVLFGL